MRPGPRHWIAAALISAAGHAGLVAWAGTAPEQASLEASSGQRADVWGMPFESIADTAEIVEAGEAEARPVENLETTETPDERQVAEERTTTDVDEVNAETADTPDVTETATASPRETAEEIVTAVLPEVHGAEAVTAEDVTVPLPRPRPADVPRRTSPPEPRKAAPRPAPIQQQAAVPAGERAGSNGQTRPDAGRQETTNYSGRIVAHLQRHKRYPAEAARQRLGGTATLSFTVTADGRVQGAQLAGPTGHPSLDSEALAMVQRAAPFPPIPPAIGRTDMTFTVPVRFAPR